MSLKLIVTHPGGAHKDDFLACCVLAHLHGVPIQRREPTPEDLADSTICVLDVGGSHEPELKNFDHHQFDRDHPPCCALSLVLQDIGIYDDALAFCNWLRPAEWLDTRGPNETAKEMGIDRDAFNALLSPIDITLLRRFASQTQWSSGDAIYQVMRMVGEDIVSYVRSLRQRLNELKTQCAYWTIESDRGTIQAVFLARTEPADEEPSFGLHQFIVSEGKDSEINAMVYPDRRGGGYGLGRFEDNMAVDFSRIESCDDVRFAHKRGFVAKTDTTDESRLKELLALAVV
ncbi:MAG: MYG1 family protein [Pirellulaceae bacterium]